MSEAINKLVNRLGQDGVAGIANRRQQRQAKRDEERRLREHVFMANQKVTRTEMQQLVNAVVGLSREVSDYKGFVRNIFFVLEQKGMVSLKEMDEIAKIKTQEMKDFQEISKNDNIPLPEKIEVAKQKGLSQVFIDMLSTPEQGQVQAVVG
jgi:hypothetical protein